MQSAYVQTMPPPATSAGVQASTGTGTQYYPVSLLTGSMGSRKLHIQIRQEAICMKCQSQFSGKKNTVRICHECEG